MYVLSQKRLSLSFGTHSAICYFDFLSQNRCFMHFGTHYTICYYDFLSQNCCFMHFGTQVCLAVVSQNAVYGDIGTLFAGNAAPDRVPEPIFRGFGTFFIILYLPNVSQFGFFPVLGHFFRKYDFWPCPITPLPRLRDKTVMTRLFIGSASRL